MPGQLLHEITLFGKEKTKHALLFNCSIVIPIEYPMLTDPRGRFFSSSPTVPLTETGLRGVTGGRHQNIDGITKAFRCDQATFCRAR